SFPAPSRGPPPVPGASRPPPRSAHDFCRRDHSAERRVWALPLVILCLLAGVYFTLRTRFVQVTGIPDMLKQLVVGEKSADGTSSFQSLMMSLANRVGMGNIGGVATAIAFGGPGAVFWMWMMAFLGAATSFIECTLGQIYKEKD